MPPSYTSMVPIRWRTSSSRTMAAAALLSTTHRLRLLPARTAASGPLVPSATIGKSETPESMDLPGIAFNVQSTLGYLANSNQAGAIPSIAEGVHNANVGLLGNYMASMFAVPSDHGAITTLAEAGLGELRAPFCCFAEPKRRKSTRDHWMKLGLGPRLYRCIVISSF